jgi:hypothetical protein
MYFRSALRPLLLALRTGPFGRLPASLLPLSLLPVSLLPASLLLLLLLALLLLALLLLLLLLLGESTSSCEPSMSTIGPGASGSRLVSRSSACTWQQQQQQ